MIGRITPERYDQLAAVYENEQADIKLKLTELEERIDISRLREECVNEFIAKAKEYVEMQTVTPELMRVFIRRIDVWEKEVKYSRTCGNRIDICFTFLPEASTTIKGECIELLPAHAAKTQNPEG